MEHISFYILRKLCDSEKLKEKYDRKIAKFIKGHTEYYIKYEKLYKLFRLYEKWLIFAKTYSYAFEQDILYYIAVRAFWSNLQDENFISKLLICINRSYSGLQCIFFSEQKWLKSRPYSSYGYSENNIEDERISFAVFFLNHACKNHLIIGSKRIVDLHLNHNSVYRHPCEIAVIARSPRLLHLLLRYGALMGGNKMAIRGYIQYRDAIALIFNICMVAIKTVLHILHRNHWNVEAFFEDVENTKLTECLNFILRISPQFRKRAISQQIFSWKTCPAKARHLQWIGQNVIPELNNHIFCPMPLKHVCRLQIRELLFVNWKLPYGIENLPIPNPLKRYLDLYC